MSKISTFFILCMSLFWVNSTVFCFETDLLPELISPSNSGTNFLISFVPVYYNALDEANYVRFYISSSTSTKIHFKVSKTFYDTTITIPANKVYEHKIHAKYVLPYSKTLNSITPAENVYEGKGLFVESDSPVIIFVHVRLKTYNEGFIALPLNFLGSEYNITTFNDYTNNKSQFAPSTAVVVSAYDNSRVTFKLGGNSATRVKLQNGDSLFSTNSTSRTLNKGDVWVIPGFINNNDLTGSSIKSTKPIAVYSGNYCAQVPTNLSPCEYLIEQELPIQSYSNRYFVTPIFGRTTGSWIKVSSYENDTEVKVNNVTKGTIAEPSGIENQGFLSFKLNFDNKPAIISSSKRINVMQFNSGNENLSDIGIPFKMQALSLDHFSKKIVFNLPGTSESQYFSENYLNIIFKLSSNGQIPDDLFITEINDLGTFKKTVKEIAKNNPVPFPVTESDGTRYYSLTLELARYGRFIIDSPKPVGALIYGKTTVDGYGTPAFIYIKNQDKISDTLHPEVIIDQSSKGNYSGIITDLPSVSSKFRSNLAMIHLVSDSSYNYVLNYDDFVPGVDFRSTFELRPANIQNDALAFLRVVDAAGNDTVIRFFYTSKPLPPKVTFKKPLIDEFCPGTNILLEYSINDGEFQGENVFRVKLGKRSPDKPNYPITIAQINSSIITKINALLPRNLVGSDDYFVYIESTIPFVYSDTLDIKILDLPLLNISGYNNVCVDNIYKYYTKNSGIDIKWIATNGEIIGPDDKDTVSIIWKVKGNNILKLSLVNEFCSDLLEYPIIVNDDFTNQIEGNSQVCKNDETFYNSLLSTGKFSWTAIGGKIIGGNEIQLIRVIWDKSGTGKLKLIYTAESGSIKESYYDVQVNDIPQKPIIARDNKVLYSSAATGNQWYFDGNLISGARAKSYDTKDIEGNYTVQVTENNCKSSISDIYEYKITSVGKLSFTETFVIFPNPANSIINFELNSFESGNFLIRLYDYKMKLIDIVELNNTSGGIYSIQYPTDDLADGLYFAVIENNGKVIYKKFVITK